MTQETEVDPMVDTCIDPAVDVDDESINETVKDRKSDVIIKHFLDLEVTDLRLKYVFDHVRNYGLAVTVMSAGAYLFQSTNLIPWIGPFIAVMLMVIGFLLTVFNIAQPIWAMVKFKVKAVPYFIVSTLLFLGAIQFSIALLNVVGCNA